MNVKQIKQRTQDNVAQALLDENEDLALAGRVIKDSIDFLTQQIKGLVLNHRVCIFFLDTA